MKSLLLLLVSMLLVSGCRQSRQHLEPSSLLAYNDAHDAARLGQNLGVQSTTTVGQDIRLQTTDGRTVKVRPSTVVYIQDTHGVVHEFFPPFEVHLEADTISITTDSEDPKTFQRSEIADVYVQL